MILLPRLLLQNSTQQLSTGVLGYLVDKSDATTQTLVLRDLALNPCDDLGRLFIGAWDTGAQHNVCTGDFCFPLAVVSRDDAGICYLVVSE